MPSKRKLTPEGSLKTAVEDLLAAERIPFYRMNAGDRFGSTNGKRWRIRGHRKGTADILALPKSRIKCNDDFWITQLVLWLELKATTDQSQEQKEFQAEVESQGQTYLLIRDVSQLQKWIREYRI